MTILYSKPGCQPCRMSKRFLEQHAIPHAVIDVTEDPSGLNAVTDLGYQSLPVIVSDAGHWSGFQPDRLKALTVA
jgi:glutaredoxin-like protein NrdH